MNSSNNGYAKLDTIGFTTKKSSVFSLSQIYPWIVILLCALFAFYKYVLQVSPSVMTTDYMHQFHVNGAGLGNLAATYFYAYLIAQLFAGLLDRYSRSFNYRRHWHLRPGGFCFASTNTLTTAGFSRAFMEYWNTAFATSVI